MKPNLNPRMSLKRLADIQSRVEKMAEAKHDFTDPAQLAVCFLSVNDYLGHAKQDVPDLHSALSIAIGALVDIRLYAGVSEDSVGDLAVAICTKCSDALRVIGTE